MFASMTANGQWVQMSNGMDSDNNVISLATIGNNILAGTNTSFVGVTDVFLSTNYGLNWTRTFLNNNVYSFAVSGSNVYAGTVLQGVYLTSNNGTNWSQIGLNGKIVSALAIMGNNVYAGTWDSGVYRSTNNGINWSQTILNNKTIRSLATLGNNVFAGTDGSGVYVSSDNGTSWLQTPLNNKFVTCLTVCGNKIYSASFFNGLSEIYTSTNNGVSWSINSLHLNTLSFAVNGNNIFAGTYGNGVLLSTNNGINWIQISEGLLVGLQTASLLITDNYIFAGSIFHSIWRRPLSEILVVQNINTEIPISYSLKQNYPNPFNPVTKIEFAVPKNSDVKITVFDVTGKEVSELVNEGLVAGTYQTDWDASAYPSGVYFYRMVTDSYSETKKMMLVR